MRQRAEGKAIVRLLLTTVAVATIATLGIGSSTAPGRALPFLAAATPDTAGAPIVADAFARVETGGWGRADRGGAYTVTGGAEDDFAVSGSEGTIKLTAQNLAKSATLTEVSVLNSDHLYRVRLDSAPSDGIVNVYHVGRYIDSRIQYRVRLTFAATGVVRVGVDKVAPDVGATDLIKPATVSGQDYQVGQFLWFRARFVGTNPTTIRAKVWADGETEPDDWLVSLDDAEPKLQAQGAVGIQVTVSQTVTNLPISVAFRDYSVAEVQTPAATPQAIGTPSATPQPVASPTTGGALPSDVVIMAAGDIACGSNTPASAACVQMETSDLILGEDPDAVLALGDIQYECGELEDFQRFFDPSWGRFKDKIRPAIGNHEYHVGRSQDSYCFGVPRGAPGYWTYFGEAATPRDPACRVDCEGYYSFDLGAWHIVALNSNCSQVDGCDAESPQFAWLRDDLAAHPATCTLAFWHHPRFSSGGHGSFDQYQDLWQLLYDMGVELVLSGHDHNYERFAPLNGSGAIDVQYGVRQFVVGTGGKNLTRLNSESGRLSTSEVFQNTTFGVLKLTLHPASYEWEFVPVVGEGAALFIDAGVTDCHGAPTLTVGQTTVLARATTGEPGIGASSGWMKARDQLTRQSGAGPGPSREIPCADNQSCLLILPADRAGPSTRGPPSRSISISFERIAQGRRFARPVRHSSAPPGA